MSEIKVNSIKGVGASAAAITVNNSDGTCTANITNNLSNRNLIINGDFSVDQRNSGSEVNPAVNNTLNLDRWKNSINSAGKYKVQQVSDSPDDFYKSLKVTSLSALSVSSGEYQHIDHNIEGLNMNHLNFGSSAAKTITLSFFVKASITGTFPVAFRNNAYNRTNVNTYTISSADTWEKKTITITGDTSGTWLQTNGIGMRVSFALAGGSDYDVSSLSTWIGSNDFTHSSCTDLLATNGATFQLAGVQLEVGSVATDFEHRSFGQELALCQRYFYSAMNANGVGEYMGWGIYLGSAKMMSVWYMPQPMRANPTVSFPTGTNYYDIYRADGSDQFDSLGSILGPSKFAGNYFVNIEISSNVSSTGGYSGTISANNSAVYIHFSAEL